jgi:hypothetical protein
MNRPPDALPYKGSMDHRYVEEADITSRYVRHRLSEDEEQRFEAHLVECASCQDAVEHDSAFRDGLSELPWQRSSAASTSAPARSWRPATLVLAVAASVLLVLSAILVVQLLRVSLQRDAATTQAADARRGQDKAEQSLTALAARLPKAPSPAASAAAFFALAMTRGAAGSAASTNQLRIGNAKLVVLAVDLARPADAARFSASLIDARSHEEIWSGGPFEAAAPETLTLVVDAGLLRPGDFMLRLERRADDGRVAPEGEYVFRVTR